MSKYSPQTHKQDERVLSRLETSYKFNKHRNLSFFILIHRWQQLENSLSLMVNIYPSLNHRNTLVSPWIVLSLGQKENLEKVEATKNIMSKVNLIARMARTTRSAKTELLRTAILALVYSVAEYCFWLVSVYTNKFKPLRLNQLLFSETSCACQYFSFVHPQRRDTKTRIVKI